MKDGTIVILFNLWGFTVTLANIETGVQIIIATLTVAYTVLKIRNEMLLRKTLKKKLNENS